MIHVMSYNGRECHESSMLGHTNKVWQLWKLMSRNLHFVAPGAGRLKT